MTDTLQTLGLITLNQAYRGDVVKQINRRVVLLKMIKIVPGEGKNVAWAPESDGQLAETHLEGADAANFGSDAQASATLNWAFTRANFHLSSLAMDAAATSTSPEANKSLWLHNMQNATTKLASLINQKCYVGAYGTGEFAGLDMAIGDDTNTYAGIARSGNAYWKPYVVDPGVATDPTLAMLRADVNVSIYEACGETPDLAMVPSAVFNKIGGLFDATRRQIDSADPSRSTLSLDAGWKALEIDGTMFVKDKDATAGQIYYLNTNYVHLEVLPSASTRQVMQLDTKSAGADDGFGVVPLYFTYEVLAKTGASEKAQVRSTSQLVVSRPNTCGVRKNVKTT